MTATDELRQMLDERGVEWWQSANTLGCVFTRWYSPIFGDEVVAMENGEEGLVLFDHFMTPEQAVEATLGETPTPPPPTPPKQPPYDELIESLRRDWDIEASWDGLRRFWYVGLTDEGVRKRDEREATLGRGTCDKDSRYMAARAENAKLRELVRVFYHCTTSGVCDDCPVNGGGAVHLMPDTICDTMHDRMRELGVEVEQ